MSAIWILQLKPFGNGKQKSNLSLKIIGLQKLWTNEKMSSSLSMKKWDKNCILDSQPGSFFIRKNLFDLLTLSGTILCQSLVSKPHHSKGVAFLLVKIVERKSSCVLQDFVPFGAAALLLLNLNYILLKQGTSTADHLPPLSCYSMIQLDCNIL